MGRATKYPYEQAKQYYVEGKVDDKGTRSYPSLREVAELFEIPENRLRERASRADPPWTAVKSAFVANMEKVRQEKRAQDLAKEAVDVDAKALKIGKLGIDLVTARMGEMAQELGKRQKAKKLFEEKKAGGASPSELADIEDYDPWAPHPVDVRELQALAATATVWHALTLRALGEVTTTRHEITGPAGKPVQLEQTIRQELVRDDASRVHGLLVAIARSQLSTQAAGPLAVDADVEDAGVGPRELPAPDSR